METIPSGSKGTKPDGDMVFAYDAPRNKLFSISFIFKSLIY